MTDDQGATETSRRGQDRRTILKGAKVVFNNGRGVLVCRVRDLSPGGARLEFPPRQTLPDTFELHVAGQAELNHRESAKHKTSGTNIFRLLF